MRFDASLVCPNCSYEKSLIEIKSDCPLCHTPLALFQVKYKTVPKEFPLSNYNFSFFRYLPFLPLNKEEILDPSVGNTPLIFSNNLAKHLGLKNLYIKDETRNPTGSFKDRGAIIGISIAKTLGYKNVNVPSSGNFASAIARACAISNISCITIVPKDAPDEKIIQIMAFGSKVLKIDGIFDDCRKISIELSKRHNIPSASWELRPFILEGWKTTIIEVLDQMNFSVPDVIIIPAGGGGHILGTYKALKELYSIGKIDHLPKIIGVQASGCSPYVKAFNNGLEEVIPEKNPRTIAKSLRVSNPFEGKYVLKAVREIKGSFIDVNDDEIIDAIILLGKTEGIFAEPAGAAPIAALKKLIKEDKIENDEKIVVIITGSGLKDISNLKDIYPKVSSISKDFNLKNILS